MSWLERIFRRRHLYDDLDEEVREHIEEKTSSSCASKISPAPRRARQLFALSETPPSCRRGAARFGNGPGLNPFLQT